MFRSVLPGATQVVDILTHRPENHNFKTSPNRIRMWRTSESVKISNLNTSSSTVCLGCNISLPTLFLANSMTIGWLSNNMSADHEEVHVPVKKAKPKKIKVVTFWSDSAEETPQQHQMEFIHLSLPLDSNEWTNRLSHAVKWLLRYLLCSSF